MSFKKVLLQGLLYSMISTLKIFDQSRTKTISVAPIKHIEKIIRTIHIICIFGHSATQ
jgi:hypothetical protein